jgi:hypothetical protein
MVTVSLAANAAPDAMATVKTFSAMLLSAFMFVDLSVG